MINKVILVGRVGIVEGNSVKTISSGSKYYKFGIALQEPKFSKEGEKPENKTVWVNILCWNKLADFCDTSLIKGMLICVEGKINPYSYQTDDGKQVKGVNIVATLVRPLETRKQQNVGDRKREDSSSDWESLPF